MSRTRITAASMLAACLVIAALLSACGGGGSDDTDSQGVVKPPADPNAPLEGTLRVFAYEDTVTDALLDPFREANPDLEVRTATFNSNQQAAAKLSGGFQADVVELCLDEMNPLLARGLIQPLDPAGVTAWNELAFTDADGVRQDGKVVMVPLSAGPQGLIYNRDEIPGGVDSFADLFDPAYSDRVALEGDYSLPAIAETALVLGYTDPMNLTPEQLSEVGDYLDSHRDQFRSLWRSDSDLVNLFKSGEVVLADGGPGIAQRMRDGGVPAEWVAPEEGALSWVCGLAITSDSQNSDAAYGLINWQASPEAQAVRAKGGYVVTNPKAMSQVPVKYRKTADPQSVENAIPETEPPHYDQWTRTFEQFQAG
jgi:spermidine/putrescine transport system substrate-binding protein